MKRALHALEGVLHAGLPHKTPTDLIFFVTDRCNARCGHCFFRYAIDADSSGNSPNLEKIERISNSLREPLHSLVLTGGEPFLRHDLADICDIFRATNNVEMIVLPTNGLLVDQIVRQVEQICARNRASIYVQVSLDGLQEMHDAIRGVTGSFQRATATAKALHGLQEQYENLYVTLATTVSQRNVDELEMVAEFVCDELSLPHSFEVVRGTQFREYSMLDQEIASPSNPPDASNGPLSLVELKRLYPRLKQIYRHNTYLVTAGHPLWTPLVYAYRTRRFWHLIDVVGNRRPFRCPAGDSIGVIYPSGDVALCELTRPVGNLADANYDLHAVWTSERAHTMRRRIRRCFCPHGCFQSVAMMREPRMYGLILASAISYVIHKGG
jgi:MoaA/NifB/PqqE/SkfB family radical SAM enzyme